MPKHDALGAICEELEALGELAETTSADVQALIRLQAQTLRAVQSLEQRVGRALDELAEVPGLRHQVVMLEQRVRAG